jgi:hypothetical protein
VTSGIIEIKKSFAKPKLCVEIVQGPYLLYVLLFNQECVQDAGYVYDICKHTAGSPPYISIYPIIKHNDTQLSGPNDPVY